MAITTRIKNLINQTLTPLGLKLDTLTTERQELQRLKRIENNGYFDAPSFPLPKSFSDMDLTGIFDIVSYYSPRFRDLTSPEKSPVAYCFDN